MNSCTHHEEPEAAHVEDTEASVDSSHGISSASATSSTLYNSSLQPFDSSSSYHVQMNNFNNFNNTEFKPIITESFDEEEDTKYNHQLDDDDCNDSHNAEEPVSHEDDILDEEEEDPNKSKMTKMIDWLHKQPITGQYAAHFTAFITALKEGFEDDSDFDIDNVLDELNYFHEGDEDDSEILTAIKENEECSANYQEYVGQLINDLRRYTGNKALPSSEFNHPTDVNQQVQHSNSNLNEIQMIDEAVEYGIGSKENTKLLYKVCSKHFTYYCCSNCGNGFARFIFSDINKEQKLEILSNYFWSSDYALRQKLIELLTQNYDLQQVSKRETLSQQLTNKDVFIDNDEQWLPIFEDVLNCQNGDILLKLSQLTCQKSAHYSLIKELRDNNTIFSPHKDENNSNLRRLQENVKRMRDGLMKLHLQMHLTNDELAVLYIIANDHEFQILSKIQDTESKFYDHTKHRTCEWKAFHLNLISAINKLKQLPDRFQIPDQLFCFTRNLCKKDDLNLYMNQITVWHADDTPLQSQTQFNCSKNTILHLTNLHSRAHSNNIQIIPIGRVINEQRDLFLVLPLRIYNPDAVQTEAASQSTCKYIIPLTADCQSLEIITM